MKSKTVSEAYQLAVATMPRDSDPDSFGFLITDVARLLRAEFDRRTSSAGLGLTPGEARTLVNAARAGTIRQSTLAERMGIEAMTLSNYLDRLADRGLIRRAVDPADKRAKLVDVTDEAQEILDAVDSIGAELRADVSGVLAPEQVDEIRAGLKQIRASLMAMRPECTKPGATA